MLIFNGGGGGRGYCGGQWGGGVVWWRGVVNLKTHCCMPDLNLTPKFKYSTLLCFNLIEILNIYRPTISFHVEFHHHYKNNNIKNEV